MPRGRMINKRISRSEKVSELPVEGQLLYTWMIPHTDVEGRLEGDVWTIKALVPYVDEITPENIPTMLNKMQAAGLIEWYGNKHKYIQINKFGDYQTLRKDQEADSTIPAPETFKNNNRVTTEQQQSNHSIKDKEKVKEKGKEKERNTKKEAGGFQDFLKKTKNDWNNFCKKHPTLPSIRTISPKRRKHLKQRYSNKDFIESWDKLFEEIEASSFLMGKNDRGWTIDFEFLIRNDENYTKILEGKYADKGKKSKAIRDLEKRGIL